MKFRKMNDQQWPQIKQIYLEAFPKKERKPFFSLKKSVKKGKALIYTASNGDTLMGFTVIIPYEDMIMVDYLAVSNKVRSQGTGSCIMRELTKEYSDKKIVLLIERLDSNAKNSAQRESRRKFYLKNGFTSSNLFVKGVSGEMEILNHQNPVTAEEYMRLQKYALGSLFFRLSRMHLIDG